MTDNNIIHNDDKKTKAPINIYIIKNIYLHTQ